MLHTSDFDFELPAELIASHPLARRDASRMLVVGGNSELSDKHIHDFLDYLRPGDVVVFNNSRVIPARFNATIDGVAHEITLHTATNDGAWWGLCKKFNKIPVGATLTLDDGTTACVIDRNDDSGLKLKFNTDDLFGVLDRVGKMPLPPYMKRDTEDADRERYQTVYAGPIGSMAAPTAGLHFTDELMREIENRGAKIVKVTLHVGAGTWMPVKTEDLSQHKMHGEWCQITPPQADIINAATRVIAVGTTSMRTLESAAIRARKCVEGKFPSGGGVAAGRGGRINKAGVNFNLPYNKSLVARARQLRKAGSLPEALLWREIKGKQINGFDFDRQKIIGNYIVDFFCPATGLVIEIDDRATHDNKCAYDAARDEYLKSLGLDVLHIPASDVLKNPASVAEYLKTTPALSATPPPEGNFACGRQRVVPFCDVTDIFITPGYKFGAVDVLLTNFHLPKSTLFMLVSAFAGLDNMRAAYRHAVAEKYRFFSYGDCCLLFKNDGAGEY